MNILMLLKEETKNALAILYDIKEAEVTVFAKGELIDLLSQNNIPFIPFDTYEDIIGHLMVD